MTSDESNPKSEIQKPARRWVRPRVVGILVVLLVVICASVVLTDRLSPRDRNAATQSAPATGRAP